jgi:glycolate oxidase FAD binding subunit
MSKTVSPKTEAELADMIADGGPFAVQGNGSKIKLGRKPTADTIMSLAAFKGVDVYEPEELILEAAAATPLHDIEKLIAERGQMLAFDPPDHGHLWGSMSRGTVGGLLATGLAGSRRLKAGSVRDHVLGVRGVTGRGEIFKAGARVVKNVTGYDMPKLMAGSFGTLAALTAVTFKVLPAPETEESVFIPLTDDQAAMVVMSQAMQSAEEVSCAAHVPGEGTLIRLEGTQVSVRARRARLLKLLGPVAEVFDETASRQYWSRIRDLRVFVHDDTRALWRISVAPMQGAAVAAKLLADGDVRHYFDWAGGLLWASLPASGDGGAPRVRGAIAEGHATLYAAPEDVRQHVPFLQPQETHLAALTGRVKQALDPLGKLNPGRMYKGV